MRDKTSPDSLGWAPRGSGIQPVPSPPAVGSGVAIDKRKSRLRRVPFSSVACDSRLWLVDQGAASENSSATAKTFPEGLARPRLPRPKRLKIFRLIVLIRFLTMFSPKADFCSYGPSRC